ncbi:hypothetical protein GCM10027075_77240 [Streptomyces heilongjiangensis]
MRDSSAFRSWLIKFSLPAPDHPATGGLCPGWRWNSRAAAYAIQWAEGAKAVAGDP